MSEDQKKDSRLAAALDRAMASAIARQERLSLEQEAKELGEEIKKAVGPKLREQLWLPCAPMPTDLCRISPFFPMSKNEMGKRVFCDDMIITKSSWGEITFSGPKLSVYEEDVLLSILAILNQTDYRQEDKVEERATYTYKGPILPILRYMGLTDKPANYKRVRHALKLMLSATFELTVRNGPIVGCGLLSGYKMNVDGGKDIQITVNPYFYEIYAHGAITLLDLNKRAELTRPLSKALFRFVMSHQENVWRGHFLTLAGSLNLDPNQTHFQQRRQIKTAIADLRKIGVLTSKSRFLDQDIIQLVRETGVKDRKGRARKKLPAGLS